MNEKIIIQCYREYLTHSKYSVTARLYYRRGVMPETTSQGDQTARGHGVRNELSENKDPKISRFQRRKRPQRQCRTTFSYYSLEIVDSSSSPEIERDGCP